MGRIAVMVISFLLPITVCLESVRQFGVNAVNAMIMQLDVLSVSERSGKLHKYTQGTQTKLTLLQKVADNSLIVCSTADLMTRTAAYMAPNTSRSLKLK